MNDSVSQPMESLTEDNELALRYATEGDNGDEDDSGSAPKKATKQSRKRTKTGCLTCRKRRIKCGEEKPTCQNCRKSKRQCEGYHQRVIFKDPLSAYHGPQLTGSSRVVFPSGARNAPSRGVRESYRSEYPLPQIPQPLLNIAPNIPSPPDPTKTDVTTQFPPPTSIDPSVTKTREQTSHISQSSSFQRATASSQQEFSPAVENSHGDWNIYNHTSQGNPLHATEFSSSHESSNPSQNWRLYPASDLDTIHKPSIIPQSIDTGCIPNLPQHNKNPDTLNLPNVEGGRGPVFIDSSKPIAEENDPDDVSEEDIHMGEDADEDDHLKNNDLGIVVAVQAQQDIQDIAIRSYTSFIDRPNMLAMYRPSTRLSPLQDSMTARIFCHFINVTAPSISMFERHPANPSLIFQGRPVAKSQQNIWTYTLPTLALQDQALLHAMLALASLHIAKLQNGPVTSCLKHCAIAIRRIAKYVAIPSKIGHPATLAATLLIGFYECWCGDHQKWSNHLLGARQLLRHTDYSGITTYIKSRSVQRHQSLSSSYQHRRDDFDPEFLDEDHDQYREDDDVDENIIGLLMGKTLRYDEYGQVIDKNYETQRDLFWWYCKQDVYQSLLSGGRLFMEYHLWSHCPPRAPIGRLNATYGTFDHVILLLGRVSDFVSKDLRRKRKVMKINGGQWRPPAAMQMSAESNSTSIPSKPPPSNSAAQPPQFPGLIPPTAEAKLPMGFVSSDDDLPKSYVEEEGDLSIQTREAEEEWSEILSAFGILQDHFGDDLQALGPEFCMPIQTPFGTALQYRTYSIAGIWMNYYMGLIALHRAHPSMPPAAMMAAGIVARQTAFFSNEIGRIAAGIAPDSITAVQVNPGVGAALIESSLCLFVAGVQYQDAAQRAWVIDKFHSIARLTGWQTAIATADGCETYWTKAAELGKGPPYTKRYDPRETRNKILNPRRKLDRDDTESSQPRPKIKTDERIHYALGILGIQEDLERLDLD
ncbi:hypothetical protein B7463_g8062, partial [Scytalidium lignicola]